MAEPLEQLPAVLIQHLAGLLPADARPAAVSVLLNFPRTAKGAIDRAALRIPAAVTAPVKPVAPPAEARGPAQKWAKKGLARA